MYNVKNFPGASPRTPIQREGEGKKGAEGMEGKGKRGEGRKGEGMGWEGKGGEEREHPQIKFYDYEIFC
jgi:hypothetical protein